MTDDFEAEDEAAALSFSGTIEIRMSVGLAHDHLRSACRFARFAYALEHGSPGFELGMARGEHDTFVIGALVFAAAFVEGEINTLYAEADDGSLLTALPTELQEPLRDQMAALFRAKDDFRLTASLDKYQNVLELAGKPRLSEKAGTPHHQARFLMNIRNRLIHFQEGSVLTWTETSDPIPPGRFEPDLKALGIGRSPLAPAGEPFFPLRMLSHQLAAAGIEWAVAWVDAFYEALGATPPPLDSMRADIRTTP